ncbi:MAG: lysophospholipid acyltransferase family protein [Planctomycetota bacterium]
MLLPELTDRPTPNGSLLRTLLMAGLVAPWSGFWGAMAMLCGALKQKAGCRWVLRCWSGGLVSAAGIRVEVLRPPPGDAGPCLFFSNHQSALDIPILLKACLRTHDVRFLAKESLFRIPFFGWGMRLSEFIPIRRERARHSAQIFQEMIGAHSSGDATVPASAAAGGRSYIIFPEGTRSPDGRLQAFKKGAIGLALRMNLPVVPVTLIDACRANPKNRYLVRPGTVRVFFHDAIPVAADSGREQRDQLAAQVYTVIRSALPDDQQPPAV